MPSLSVLSKVAVVGSLLVVGASTLWKRKFDRCIRETETYKEALDIVFNHKKTVEHLGQPVEERGVKLKEHNNVNKLVINLKGKNTNGVLDCEYFFNKLEEKTHLKKLEIKFANIPKKTFVIYETLT